MKTLQLYINEAADKWISCPDPDSELHGEEAYELFVIPGINWLNEFNYDVAYRYAEYPEGFAEYSKRAKNSLNTAGKKCAKLLEKIIKPKFLVGKTTKSIDELEKEFYNKVADFFVDEAWEWAPGANTDAMYNYWDHYEFFDDLREYFNEDK